MEHIDFLKKFYNSAAGEKVASDVAHSIECELQNKKVLAVGFSGDFLDYFENKNLFYAIPKPYEAVHWPKIRPFKTVIVEERAFPFAPNTWDVVVVIHYLEFSNKNKEFLNEMRRILKSGGKLIVVSTNKYDVFRNHSPTIKKHSVSEIISSLLETSFSIGKIVGINEKLRFWPYRFSYNLSKYNELLIGFFPFLSDVVVITSEKKEPAAEIVESLKEQYEMT